jgi:Sulfotransferase family
MSHFVGLMRVAGECYQHLPLARKIARESEIGTGFQHPSEVTLIIGAPRSGTTWLAKIFDSHPRVLYRHEPDLSITEPRLPRICRIEEVPCYSDAVGAFIDALINTRNLKAVGKLPLFKKAGDLPFARTARTAIILALRLAHSRPGRERLLAVQLPRSFDWNNASSPHVVIKSISSLGRARLLAAGVPRSRIIMIVRNPLEQIASRLSGSTLGKMRSTNIGDELLGTDEAVEFDVSPRLWQRLPLVDKLAWEWAILHEKAISELALCANARFVRYTDLVHNPVALARGLFTFVGLSWEHSTERFIHKSTTYRGPDLYFHVCKRGEEPLHKWRNVLNPDDQARILSIVRLTTAALLYPELLSGESAATSVAPVQERARHAGSRRTVGNRNSFETRSLSPAFGSEQDLPHDCPAYGSGLGGDSPSEHHEHA